MSNIAQGKTTCTPLIKSGLIAKLWPNGEISIYRPNQNRPASEDCDRNAAQTEENLISEHGVIERSEEGARASLMGLLNAANFDKAENSKARYGLKGISSRGKRTVRNCCYLLEKENDKRYLTFATVTLPSMPVEHMAAIHQNWHRVIDAYRREVKRVLVSASLPGDVIGVTEIQPKRFKETGLPVLHGHFVFVGRKRGQNWALSPAKHDEIWLRALEVAMPGIAVGVASAAQLKPLKGSAEGYLSKYLSKGADDIAQVIAAGFEWWLPRQWWNASRRLTKRVKNDIKVFNEGINWLLDNALTGDKTFWTYFYPIEIEILPGDYACLGYCGRLTPTAKILICQVLRAICPEN